MNIFTMLSSSRGSKIGNVIKFSNYKSSVLHTELRVSTLVLFINKCTHPEQDPLPVSSDLGISTLTNTRYFARNPILFIHFLSQRKFAKSMY